MTADPQAPGPLTVVPPPVHGPQYGEGTTKEFTFTYHGYMSAPILISIGQRQPGPDLTAASSSCELRAALVRELAEDGLNAESSSSRLEPPETKFTLSVKTTLPVVQ